jgi:RNA polymerase sigma-70 factor (ECF subfamily)
MKPRPGDRLQEAGLAEPDDRAEAAAEEPVELSPLPVAEPAGDVEADEAAAARAEDHALIRRAQQGEEEAFASLVRRHQTRAWRIARNLVASEDDALDLAQEAFLRVFKNLASFDFDHGFTTWLYRIVTNLAIDHLRKRRPSFSTTGGEDEGDLDLVDPDVERPSDGLEREELGHEVRACLANLAPHFQSVLLLREIEGLPCNEIAHIVGATHVTVRWRLHRARKLFQEEWERRARLSAAGGDLAGRSNAWRGLGVDPSEDEESQADALETDEIEGEDGAEDGGRRGR